jgi:hypothetical protein
MMTSMTGPDEHVLGGFRPFGLRRWVAMCSCGYETRPAEGIDEQARVEAARHLLINAHGAREPHPGEAVGVPLNGGSGPVRPGPARPWSPPHEKPRSPRRGRLP